jgi:hypothetical protein
MLYFDNVYCNGYTGDGYLRAQPPKEHFVLTHLGTANMPFGMRDIFSRVEFNHPHYIGGVLTASGPGAMVTTDILEIHGELFITDGAELFSMIEHDGNIVEGSGHIHVDRCGKWLLGNDATQRAFLSPNVTVADGGALVVPRHAKVTLNSGHFHVRHNGRIHVDGHLLLGNKFTWHTVDGRETIYSGSGEITKTTDDEQ